MSDSSKAVFLSYASQDANAARCVCESLRQAGVEVWFDADGGLEHGDEWDAKIRRQIKECVLFIPIISAHTQARLEGYFRIEWALAAERAVAIADGVPFILPIVIDDTREPEALVPDRFRKVQWMRLPGGVVTAQVQQRLVKLWSHRIGAAASRGPETRDQGPGVSEKSASAQPATNSFERRVIRRRVALLAILVALAIGGGWWVMQSGRREPSAKRDTQLAAPAKPETEAQRLAATVREVLFARGLPWPGELDRASEQCHRAAELDATDADVWATWAQVEALYVGRGIDVSAARQESARAKAARAMKLGPNAFEPRLAHALTLMVAVGYMTESRFTREAETMLRALLQERPNEPRVLVALGHLLGGLGRIGESIEWFEKLARNPAWTATAYSSLGWQLAALRPEDAFAAAEKSIAAQPQADNLGLQLTLALDWFGDLDLAKQAADKIAAADLRGLDGTALSVARVYWWRRESKEMLQVLKGVPRDWLQTRPFGSFDGPKDYWAGLAYHIGGDSRAAQRAWQAALALIEQRTQNSAEAERFAGLKAELQMRLGDPSGDDAIESLRRSGRGTPRSVSILRGDFDALRSGLEKLPWSILRFSPEFDPLRQDPRFQTLLTEAEKDPKRSPRAMKAAATTLPVASADKPAQADKSIAVLAFENLSGDKDNEYFSDGISEELLNVLAKVPGLRVAARTSAFYFKGKQVPLAEIAKQLNVTHVVEGSVRKFGSRVRITAKLIKVDDGFTAWSSDNIDRESQDIFAVQAEIAGLVAKNLSLKLGAGATGRTGAVNPQAYELYLQGRQAWNLRTNADNDRAEALFTKAIELDPKFARAYVGRVDVQLLRAVARRKSGQRNQRQSQFLAAVRREIDRALELEPDSAEAHASLGLIQTHAWDGDAAERAYRRATELNPNYATAHHWLANLLLMRGRIDEARAEIRRAVEADPLSPIIARVCSYHFLLTGFVDEALALAERALALQPDSIHIISAKASALVELGRWEEALPLARHVASDETAPAAARDVKLLLRLGMNAEAQRRATGTDDDDVKLVILAAGKKWDEFFAQWAKRDFASDGLGFLFEPLFDPVRRDPRFLRPLEEVGLLQAHERVQAWRAQHPRKERATR